MLPSSLGGDPFIDVVDGVGSSAAPISAALRRQHRKQTGSKAIASSSKRHFATSDRGSRSGSGSGSGSGSSSQSSSSSSSSEEAADDTDEEERTLLAEEEKRIRQEGMDTDEENNVPPETPAAHGDGSHPPIMDPNDLDHVWSSEYEEHFSDFHPHSHSHSQSHAHSHSHHHDHKATRTSGGKQATTNANATTTATTTANKKGKAAAATATSVVASRKIPCTRNRCKTKAAKKAAPSSSSPALTPAPTPTTTPTATPSSPASTAAITPQIIQTYLAGRGITVSMENASQLAASLSNGAFLQSMVQKGEKSAEGALLASRMNDPRFVAKETKKLEALHAQAYGDASGTSRPKRGEAAKTTASRFSAPLPSTLDMSMLSSSSSSGAGTGTGTGVAGASAGQEEEEMLAIEEVLDLRKTHASTPESAAEKAKHKLLSRWDRIPIGTFRRSRRISKPLLKLSKAVKSTLGVVPRSIHETLLGGNLGLDGHLSADDSGTMSSLTAMRSATSMKSPFFTPTTTGARTGMGATVQKKLVTRKNHLMKAMKLRNEHMRRLVEMVIKQEDHQHQQDEGLSDDGSGGECSSGSSSDCSCCPCECDDCTGVAAAAAAAAATSSSSTTTANATATTMPGARVTRSDDEVLISSHRHRGVGGFASRMSAPVFPAYVDDSDIDDDFFVGFTEQSVTLADRLAAATAMTTATTDYSSAEERDDISPLDTMEDYLRDRSQNAGGSKSHRGNHNRNNNNNNNNTGSGNVNSSGSKPSGHQPSRHLQRRSEPYHHPHDGMTSGMPSNRSSSSGGGGLRSAPPSMRASSSFSQDEDESTMSSLLMSSLRSRRNSMPFADLSMLIHDPSHPPSACASPNNVFLYSPSLNPFGANGGGGEGAMDKLELEPAIMAISSDPLLSMGSSPSTKPLMVETVMASGVANGNATVVANSSNTTNNKPRVRKSSLLGVLPHVRNVDSLLDSFQWH